MHRPYKSLVILIVMQIFVLLSLATSQPVDADLLLVCCVAFGIYWAGWIVLLVVRSAPLVRHRFGRMGVPLCLGLVIAVLMVLRALPAAHG